MFVLAVLGTLVNAGSLLFVEPGTVTYVVVQLNFIGLILLLLFTGGVLLMCYRRL